MAETETETKPETKPDAIEKKPERKLSVLDQVKRELGRPHVTKSVTEVLPDGIGLTPKKFIQMVSSYISINAADPKARFKIIECEGQSILRSVVQAAELGLVPGSALGHCHLIPYGGLCSLMIGVWGYVELARRGGIKEVWADVVYEADDFIFESGSERKLIHRPRWDLEPGKEVSQGGRGQRQGAYAVAVLPDGTRTWEIMAERELEKARRASATKGDSPVYRDWPDEMAKKTAIKRARKTWPVSLEAANAIAKAVEFDHDSIDTSGEPVEPVARVPDEGALDGFVRRQQEADARSRQEATENEDQTPPEKPEDVDQDRKPTPAEIADLLGKIDPAWKFEFAPELIAEEWNEEMRDLAVIWANQKLAGKKRTIKRPGWTVRQREPGED